MVGYDADIVSDGLGDPLGEDGLNAGRALILHAYYGLRCTRAPQDIGTTEIVRWIEEHQPHQTRPSPSLIRLTLVNAKVPHRPPGRPESEPPFCPPVRAQAPRSRSKK